jgi:hypothetical protein
MNKMKEVFLNIIYVIRIRVHLESLPFGLERIFLNSI